MSAEALGLQGWHPIISCEGTAEEVVVKKLLAADALVFSRNDVVEVTRKRRAKDIQDEFLNYDYEWPVCILRVLDSRNEGFKLGALYAGRFPVRSFFTHPEVEVLTVINEGEWRSWKSGQKKPSQFCKEDLRMGGVKQRTFLEGYWRAESIATAAREYKRLSRLTKGELCLADLIRDDFR